MASAAIAKRWAAFLSLPLALAYKPDAYSLRKSEEILSRFEKAVPSIEDFRREHGRLPTTAELNERMRLADQPMSLNISADGFQDCDRDLPQFRKAKKGSYVLAIWRGEWLECYDPITKTSSL
ncbi:hypothetical protein ACT009_09135 [Sphingomonas sp. Tas61C01]|uniref:hypothetical protein n=1 Tax=Sphingomonas sp. Tas61C01 TaxID=3458297 RepID=UPI00403EAE08